ncbi:uncharacterized protein LOC128216760 isoform X2 [Mya arenaria]|uniref:uncharacterized protein LOC128216760 isoform X2 n=1 Tax=Mya arenaria TaxID=6604 RepID=UPI0022E8E7A7|nr:uncharacterized protein LOC128216760 isoform X2 [Mya arenaria]
MSQGATDANGDDEDDGPVTVKTNTPQHSSYLFIIRCSAEQNPKRSGHLDLCDFGKPAGAILILARGSAQDAVPSELPEEISFPLKTVVDLAAFKERKSQANAATSIVKYLAEYGGSDTVDTFSRIMKTVLTTNLARQYNLKETKQKKKLDRLHLINIFFRCQ